MDEVRSEVASVVEAVRVLLRLNGRDWSDRTIKYMIHLTESGKDPDALADLILECEGEVAKCIALEQSSL